MKADSFKTSVWKTSAWTRMAGFFSSKSLNSHLKLNFETLKWSYTKKTVRLSSMYFIIDLIFQRARSMKMFESPQAIQYTVLMITRRFPKHSRKRTVILNAYFHHMLLSTVLECGLPARIQNPVCNVLHPSFFVWLKVVGFPVCFLDPWSIAMHLYLLFLSLVHRSSSHNLSDGCPASRSIRKHLLRRRKYSLHVLQDWGSECPDNEQIFV